jgi:hypothetical protein
MHAIIKVTEINDEVQVILNKLKDLNLDGVSDKSIQDLKKRKLVAEVLVLNLCALDDLSSSFYAGKSSFYRL